MLLASLLVVTAACGAYRFPGEPGTATGAVTGTVMVFPCAPVEQQDLPCKGLPGSGLVIVFTNESGSTGTTVNSDGRYSITLPAGTWRVSFKGVARIISGPQTIAVPAGGSVVANYVVDSGIRYPAPQAAG